MLRPMMRSRCPDQAAPYRLDRLGSSVTSRMTAGLPSDGASSWTPPESVMINVDRFIRYTNGW